MADGTITIDVDIPTGKVKSDTDLINVMVDSIGKNAGKDLDTNFNKKVDNVKDQATSASREINQKLGRKVETKITADTHEVREKSDQASRDLKKIPDHKNTKYTVEDQATPILHKTSKEADETGSHFHKLRNIIHGTFIGSLAAQGLTNALGAVKNAMTRTISEGLALNGAVGKIKAQFKSMGMSDKWVNALTNQIGYLKMHFAATGAEISTVQKNMMNWSRIGRRGAMQMTTALTAAAASGRLTGEQYAQVAQSMMRVGSSGKVTLGTLSRITRVMPNLYKTLAEGAGVSESKMKSMLATGKVSLAQFQKWLADASKGSKKAFADYVKTQGGAANMMKQSWMGLEAEMTKPLFDVKSSGMQELATLMNSKPVQQGARLIGEGIQQIAIWGMKVLEGISRHKSDVVGIMSDIVKIGAALAKDVWKDFSQIIVDIAKSLGLMSNSSKKSGDSLHQVRLAMDGLARNKGALQAIARIIEAIAVIKLAKTANGLLHITSIAKGGIRGIKGIAEGIKGVDDASKLTGIEKWGSKLGGIFSSIPGKAKAASKAIQGLFGKGNGAGKLNGLLQSAHSAGGFKNLTTAGKIGTGAAGIDIAVDTATSIVKAIKDKAGSRKQYEDIGTSAGKGIGGAIGLYFGGPAGAAIGAQIGGAVGKWAGDAAKNFQNGWNKKKPPKKFWSLENLGWSTHAMFKKAGKWGQGVAKSFQTGLKKDKSRIKSAWNSVTSSVGKANSAVKKNFSKFSNFLHKSIKKGADKAGKAFKKGWDYMYKHGSKGTKQIMRSTSKFAKNYVKINKRANDETRKNFASFGKRLKRNHGDLFKTIGQTTKEQLKIEKKRWSSNWKNIKSTASEIWKGIKSNAKGFYDDLNKKTHGGLGKVVSGFQSFGKKLASFWSGLFSGIKKTFDNVIGGISKTIGGLGSGIGKFFSGKLKVGSLHLAGGTDWRDRWGTPAILNDGNDSPETGNREGLIHQDGTLELIEGRNVKRWLFPGEDVINAHDMASLFTPVHFARGTRHFRGSSNSNKLTGGSLAKMLKELEKMLSLLKKVKKASSIKLKVKGLTSALKTANKLNKTVKSIGSQSKRSARNIKSIGKTLSNLSSKVRKAYGTVKKYDIGKLLSKETRKAVKSFDGKGNFATAFKKHAEKMIEYTKKLVKDFQHLWKKNWDDGDKLFKNWSRTTLMEQNSFDSKFERGWRSLDSGTERIYRRFWSSMRNLAGKGMNGVIGVLNSGISKINGVISDFGGSSHAVGYAGHVHYATGTGVFNNARRPITRPMLAMVNDGNDSPETGNREALWRPSTGYLGVFEGRNVLAPVMPGDEIFNASEARELGITSPQHFATGTGGLKQLYELAKRYWKNPVKTGGAMFGSVNGLSGAMNQLGQGMRDFAKKQGVNWWSQLWKMVDDKVNDDAVGKGGTREAFLKYAEKTFAGVKYIMGAASKVASDCSGMVMQALQKFGVNIGRTTVAMQESSGVQYLGKNIRKTVPGDLVIFGHGTGAAGHVGIVKNPKAGTMFNETPPYARVSRIADDESMGYGFYRVKGLHNAVSKNPDIKAKTSLQKQIRLQVGKGFWATIQKIADKYGENDYFGGKAGKPIGDYTHWMKQAHIPRRDWSGIEYIVSAESGWNPHALNPSSGTYGLGQMQGYNLHYYTRHGSKNNPIAQLMGMMDYIHDRYGSVANAVSFRRAHNWYADGGFIDHKQYAVVGDGNGPEVVLPYGDPSKRERTLQLMQATIAQMQMQDGMSQKLDANKGTDMTVVNSAIDQINKKFDQALEALGIITAKDDNFTIVSKVDEQTMSAVYRKFKKYDTQNMRRAAKNISGYQTF